MKIVKAAFGTLGAVILIGAIGAAALYSRLESAKSDVNPGGKSNEEIWNAAECRARLYLQSALGRVPELSMTRALGADAARKGVPMQSRRQPGGEHPI